MRDGQASENRLHLLTEIQNMDIRKRMIPVTSPVDKHLASD
jgi:hypothetical protein